jgi:hypothetical protein
MLENQDYMRKGLLTLSVLLTLSGVVKAQNIPEIVKNKALDYINYASNSACGSVPDVSLVGKKLEDRENRIGIKDGVKDSAFLYQINNPCKGWPNVPSYIVYTRAGKKDGTFDKVGYLEDGGIRSRDEKDNPLMPKDW